MIVCPNTSPLIVLARIERLDLLGPPSGVVLTRAVLDEVREKSDEATSRVDQLARQAPPMVDLSVPDRVDPYHDLGPGERSVIGWALAGPQDALCILDDQAAREEARRLGLRLTGTLGLVLRAKMDGRLAAAAPLLREAVSAGLYLDDAILSAALARIGEAWGEPA